MRRRAARRPGWSRCISELCLVALLAGCGEPLQAPAGRLTLPVSSHWTIDADLSGVACASRYVVVDPAQQPIAFIDVGSAMLGTLPPSTAVGVTLRWRGNW